LFNFGGDILIRT